MLLLRFRIAYLQYYKFMELSKLVLENLQYLPLLQLQSPFQLVVLVKQFKLFTVANLCDIILSHISAVCWLNVTYIFKI